jgi:hypothetical protein
MNDVNVHAVRYNLYMYVYTLYILHNISEWKYVNKNITD